MTKKARLVAYGFLVLSGAHLLLGFVFVKLPSWKMFHAMPRYRFEIRDARGQPVVFHDYLPPRAYFLISSKNPVRLAVWLANREPERAPIDVRVTTLTSTSETTREYRARAGQTYADVLGE
ncbi:MAG TPA: hypothetical protein VJU61_23455 [Polyangiaceae bacterium]|nr:hypothetical protein [Polyangiaceae bacterium]